MQLHVANNKVILTESLPSAVEPISCGKCGGRIGWLDEEFGEPGVYYCDECAADLSSGAPEGSA